MINWPLNRENADSTSSRDYQLERLSAQTSPRPGGIQPTINTSDLLRARRSDAIGSTSSHPPWVEQPITTVHPSSTDDSDPLLDWSFEGLSGLTDPTSSSSPRDHQSQQPISESTLLYSLIVPATTDLSTNRSNDLLSVPLKGPSGSAGSTSDHSPHDYLLFNKGGSTPAQPLNTDGMLKRPTNAFMIFSRKRRPEVSATNKTMGIGEITKLLAKEWDGMDNVSRFSFV